MTAAILGFSFAMQGSGAVADCEAEFTRWLDALPDWQAAGAQEMYMDAKTHAGKEHAMAIYKYIDEMVKVKYNLDRDRPVSSTTATRFILVDDWLTCTEGLGYEPDTPIAIEFFSDFYKTIDKDRSSLRQTAEAAQ
ncbi:hypothetical protein [Roseobacter sinensis]|uniref:Uncharacterized protein n=1 Tax=Roseobacter sinensis TaxID=2931391 RepID=A0ABT3BFW8_9RHOB|nr:hypothetical protein [Roseobacter sp. WL0113]MCV3272463.1 hypothetical protein [Roseobacter sp. WL0113]